MIKLILCLITILFLTQDAYPYTIALDIGHTDKSPGAIGASGTPEIIYNRKVAEDVKTYIEEKGKHSAFFIQNVGLKERTEIANNWADIFISIHHDSVTQNLVPFAYKFRGFALFVSDKNPSYKKGLLLAKLIGSKLVRNDFYMALHHEGNRSRKYVWVDKETGVYKGNVLTVIKDTKIPAVLVECGIIKNLYEETWLALPENHNKLVSSIGDSVDEFFERWFNKTEFKEDIKLPKKEIKKITPPKKVKPKGNWVSA